MNKFNGFGGALRPGDWRLICRRDVDPRWLGCQFPNDRGSQRPVISRGSHRSATAATRWRKRLPSTPASARGPWKNKRSGWRLTCRLLSDAACNLCVGLCIRVLS